jgi:hypothetical protein
VPGALTCLGPVVWIGQNSGKEFACEHTFYKKKIQSQDLKQPCNFYYFLLEKLFSFCANFYLHGGVQEHMNLANQGLSVSCSGIIINTNSASNAVIIANWYEELKINQFGVQTKCDCILIV